MRPLVWLGTAKRDYQAFPDEVKRETGFALYQAQIVGRGRLAKTLSGFGDASVLEIRSDHEGDTFRAVYTVRFKTAVYVLHAFQKKSKTGIATPKADLDLIAKRLRDAKALDEETNR